MQASGLGPIGWLTFIIMPTAFIMLREAATLQSVQTQTLLSRAMFRMDNFSTHFPNFKEVKKEVRNTRDVGQVFPTVLDPVQDRFELKTVPRGFNP